MTDSVQANTLKKYLLEFESVGRLAAETFEALLVMAEISNGGESLLAQCVDLENFRQYLSRAGLEYLSSWWFDDMGLLEHGVSPNSQIWWFKSFYPLNCHL